MQYMGSLVVVKDVGKSRKLYEGILGQTVVADYGENVAFEGGFALHEKKHFRTLIGGRNVQSGSNSFELYFDEENVDEVFAAIKAHGLNFVHEVIEQPWRQKVFRFYDYDSNIIEIGEPMPHVAYRLHRENMPLSDICKITYMDEATAKASIAKYTK